MNVHKNARLTPFRRREMALAVRAGLSQAEAARQYGVSRPTVRKWVTRFEELGEAGVADRSSRPHRSPTQLTEAEEERLLALRMQWLLAVEVAAQMKRSVSSICRRLRRYGFARLRDLDKLRPKNRYEKERPGELVHLDIKKLGRFKTPGHRVNDDRTTRDRNVGWEHVHVCVDDHSRFAYVEVLDEGEKGTATSAFLERAFKAFEARGIRIERVLTDNGSGYRSRLFRKTCQRLGLKHSRTRPYTPRTNGKAERFIQSMIREWAYVRPYGSSRERRRALPRWVNRYNHTRPHSSLGAKPPISRLKEVHR